MDIFLQLFTALLGSAGFALIFNLRARYLALAAAGGVLCWGTYLLMTFCGEALFPASLIAAAVSALYAEIAARFAKAPATLILIPTVIPLIPGSSLYYTMSRLCLRDWAEAREYAVSTGLCAVGIAAGVGVIFALFTTAQIIKKKK